MHGPDLTPGTPMDIAENPTYDVVIVGGGPAGSTTATLLAREGLRVAVIEREVFPRFHVGESLLPANLPILDRLGCHETIRNAGFMYKPGATIYDEFEGRGQVSFPFPTTRFQPNSAYQVVRSSFDTLLLQHAAETGALVYRQHTVKHTRQTPDTVIAQIETPAGMTHDIRTQVLVDASGRQAFLGTQMGRRESLPGLGKVALFAHYKGMQREPGGPEGNARIYLIPHGWLWWFSFSDGTESLGCVVHAQVAKSRQGSVEDLFDEALAMSPHITAGLQHAERITPVHRAANFSYRISPCVGDRYLAIGDAAGFIDPIFSTGVFFGMRSGELAAEAILKAVQQQDFRAQNFRKYEVKLRRGIAPFITFIQHFYDPAFLDVFFTQRPPMRLDRPVLWVLSGAVFDHRPLWLRAGLALFFGIVRVRRLVRWVTGLPITSRGSW